MIKNWSVRVLGIGDIEGNVGNHRLAKAAAVINRIASASTDTVILANPGDNLTGNYPPDILRQAIKLAFWDTVPRNVLPILTVGNNDFGPGEKDGAPDALTEATLHAIEIQGPPILAVNLWHKNHSEPLTPQYFLEKSNGILILRSGLANPDLKNYNEWAQQNFRIIPLEELNDLHWVLSRANLGVIAFHEGRSGAREAFKNFKTDTFTVVLGGHYHDAGPPELIHPNVLYFEAGWGCKMVRELHIQSENGNVHWDDNVIRIDEETITPHPKVDALILPFESTVAVKALIAKTGRPLDWVFEMDLDLSKYPRNNPSTYPLETAGGNFAADAIVRHRADLAILNARSMRASIQGDITQDALEKMLTKRHDGPISTGNITIKDLLEMFNRAYADSNFSRSDKHHADPIHFAGATITVDLTLPEGTRVRDITLNDGTILVKDGVIKGDLKGILRVATRKFLIENQTDPPYEPLMRLQDVQHGMLFSEALLNHLLAMRNPDTLEIPDVPLGRLKILD